MPLKVVIKTLTIVAERHPELGLMRYVIENPVLGSPWFPVINVDKLKLRRKLQLLKNVEKNIENFILV